VRRGGKRVRHGLGWPTLAAERPTRHRRQPS
jgi:hypothetical protein